MSAPSRSGDAREVAEKIVADAIQSFEAAWSLTGPTVTFKESLTATIEAALLASGTEWRAMDTAPKSDKAHILLLFGETIPDVPDVRVGAFITGEGAEELGYREYAKHGGWLIWNSDSDFYVVDLADPRGWQSVPSPAVHLQGDG